MAYRKRTHMSAKMAAAMAAKVRLRMERPAPDRLPELPLLRRTVVVTDYDFGHVEHRLDLYRTNRRGRYRVEKSHGLVAALSGLLMRPNAAIHV